MVALMASTIKEVEALPDAYPDAPVALSAAASALDLEAIWQRIEAYCRFRWAAREVVWTVEGDGEWSAPLLPTEITVVEHWQDETWIASLPIKSPVDGLIFHTPGHYRITATVGPETVPRAVVEAFRRLAEYYVDSPDRSGASSYSVNLGGAIEESYQRSSAYIARAMDLSGASDLLRPYKRRA
jgi:hypothetical protein